jgi:Protein of unknown function (DUF667)
MALGEDAVECLLPPHAEECDFETLEAVKTAMHECAVFGEGNEVAVFDDEELNVQLVEVQGERAKLTLPCSSIKPLLCMHIKMLEQFCSLEIEIVDDTKRYRSINLSNARSVATIEGSKARLPLQLANGWNHVSIDLDEIVQLAFGSQYLTTCQVAVCGSCRVSKIFFQDAVYADVQLPKHLRVLSE